MQRRFIASLVAAATALTAAVSAVAQTFPAKPIRLIVPFAAGGGTDTMGRVLAQKMSESIGQPVVVENRAGSDTIVGADFTAKAPPDGHTILLALDIAVTMNQWLYSKLPYDPVKDLAPVSLVASTPLILVGNPNVPVRTMADLVSHAKANPGKLNYGSGAIVAQLIIELLKQSTGIQMVFVPFKGAAPTTQALLANDIQFAIADFFSFLPHIKSGKLVAIASTGRTREPTLPDMPTMIESGYPNMEVGNWWAVYAPGGTPAPVVERLNREVVKAVASPEVTERYRAILVNPASSTPEALAARQAADADRWRGVIRSAGIKLD